MATGEQAGLLDLQKELTCSVGVYLQCTGFEADISPKDLH